MDELTPTQRRALKARAHSLEPVVLVGDKGLTGAVLAEIDRALAAHELIKVRVQAEREDRAAILDEICSRAGAAPVQHIGKILVVYRPGPPEPPAPPAPRARKANPRKAAARALAARDFTARKAAPRVGRAPDGRARRPGTSTGGRAAKGTGRPGSRTASPRPGPARPPRRPRTSR